MTTPTGIPITLCTDCNREHPVTRQHCPVCGLASLFGHESCMERHYATQHQADIDRLNEAFRRMRSDR